MYFLDYRCKLRIFFKKPNDNNNYNNNNNNNVASKSYLSYKTIYTYKCMFIMRILNCINEDTEKKIYKNSETIRKWRKRVKTILHHYNGGEPRVRNQMHRDKKNRHKSSKQTRFAQ